MLPWATAEFQNTWILLWVLRPPGLAAPRGLKFGTSGGMESGQLSSIACLRPCSGQYDWLPWTEHIFSVRATSSSHTTARQRGLWHGHWRRSVILSIRKTLSPLSVNEWLCNADAISLSPYSGREHFLVRHSVMRDDITATWRERMRRECTGSGHCRNNMSSD